MTSRPGELPNNAGPPIVELVRGFSLEVSCHDEKAIAQLPDCVASGTDVYLPWIPGDSYRRVATAATKLRLAGINPVPHIVARRLRTQEELLDYILRLREEAAVREVLIIAGDDDRASGPFASSLDIVKSGILERNDINRIGFGGHPEGHRRVAEATMFRALIDKIDSARARGITPYIVTQFCFAPEPIVNYITRIRDTAPDVEIRIGLAGPATPATLVKFALRCGIGNSIRALASRGTAFGRLLTETNPIQLINSITLATTSAPSLQPLAYHFFPFGGLERLIAWLNSKSDIT